MMLNRRDILLLRSLYALLAVACIIYLVFDTSEWLIVGACVPGNLVFLGAYMKSAYDKGIELQRMLGRIP